MCVFYQMDINWKQLFVFCCCILRRNSGVVCPENHRSPYRGTRVGLLLKTLSLKFYNNNNVSHDNQIEQDINTTGSIPVRRISEASAVAFSLRNSFTKEEGDTNKMLKTIHEIRNFRTLDDTTINYIQQLDDSDKMRIIISFNNVVESMQLIFESLLN